MKNRFCGLQMFQFECTRAQETVHYTVIIFGVLYLEGKCFKRARTKLRGDRERTDLPSFRESFPSPSPLKTKRKERHCK